jgi:lipopolysaccharide/colanic/teichoic acid biosynthesis glycosyltransferase
MVMGAESQKLKVKRQNEVDGPVFKIYDDPRFTKVGKILSHTGLDELPQLVNILKGDMALVGPRPLPVEESKKIPRIYESRYRVLPGIISPWVVGGYHKVSFNKWMESDVQYVKNKNIFLDIKLCLMTVGVVWKMFKNELLKSKKSNFS